MFNREDFDRMLRVAENHFDNSEIDPKLRDGLIMMMNAMKTLADSCEHDLTETLRTATENFKRDPNQEA